MLSGVAASEPGPWRTDRTPYLREIMDCLSASSPIQDVVFMGGTQIGKTECGANFIGYVIDHSPGPMLFVQPTLETCGRVVSQRINPLIESSPALKAKVADRKSRVAGNTARLKEFPGGVLIITGANSAAGLRSMPARYRFFDEVDAYPQNVEGEGDPIELADKRSSNFRRRKSLKVSTPTRKRTSKIEKLFLDTDQRRYFVPCPFCGFKQTLTWERIKWDKDASGNHLPDTAACECECCTEPDPDSEVPGAMRPRRIPERYKTAMLAGGEWRPTAPENADGRNAGFHLSALYSPIGWFSWADAVRQFLKAVNQKKSGSLAELITFTNTVLAETWEERGEAPAWEILHGRREPYPQAEDGSVLLPRGVLFLTAGVDVQKDRLEVQIVGWGRGKENWTITHFVLGGDPYQALVWTALREVLFSTFRHEGGVDLPILRMAVDSGYATQNVYQWGRLQPPDRLLVIKGNDSGAVAIGAPAWLDIDLKNGDKVRRGARVWPVGTRLLKSELYGSLRLPAPEPGMSFPPGWCHFGDNLDQEFFQQLCAEELVTKKNPKGFSATEWIKTRERNEALDCRVYARAAASQCGLDRMTDGSWKRLEEMYGLSAPVAESVAAPVESPRPTVNMGAGVKPGQPQKPVARPAPQRKVIPSNWMNQR
jgi:phage terminase large subunit GpA-like protein